MDPLSLPAAESSDAMITADELLADYGQWSMIDVRAPAEFAKGHLPGSRSVPLFTDEQRAEIGLLYRHEGRQVATLRGLEIVGTRMRPLAEAMIEAAAEKPLLVMCWRGGMRSASMAWLAAQVGLTPTRLEGGYKAFRQAALAQFARSYKIQLLGGETGSGKTPVLLALQAAGGTVVDLEGLANHKGSAFGSLGQPDQPSQQTFENRLAVALAPIDGSETLWLESESRRIGKVGIPDAFWSQMKAAPLLRLQVPLEQRVAHLMEEYGTCEHDGLADAIRCIEQRLGGLNTRLALEALERDDLEACCELLLREYYDRSYLHSVKRRDNSEDIGTLPWDGLDIDGLVQELLARS